MIDLQQLLFMGWAIGTSVWFLARNQAVLFSKYLLCRSPRPAGWMQRIGLFKPVTFGLVAVLTLNIIFTPIFLP